MMGYIPMTHGDGGGEVDESHHEQKSEEIRVYRLTVGSHISNGTPRKHAVC